MGDRPVPHQASHQLRVAVVIAYYALVAAFIVVAASNIVRQLWGHSHPNQHSGDCRSGLVDLARAVERARSAASTSTDGDETLALSRFRESLAPEWERYEAIAGTCRVEPTWASSLDVIERLRYAEERAVRRDVAELSPLRRKVVDLLATRLRDEP